MIASIKALKGAKNEPAATDRINRRRQLAAYYVEQIKLVALCCQDRSYNAIDVFEGRFRTGAVCGSSLMIHTLTYYELRSPSY